VLSLHIAGKVYRCVLEESAEGTAVHLAGERMLYRVEDPRSLKSRRSRQGGADGPKPLKAPMPGRVVRVLANVGDQVEAHQGIVVIEAMKMQNELKSPKTGRLVELRAEPGATVAAGDVLAIVD
jgi:biotin carboxyl carrier protein